LRVDLLTTELKVNAEPCVRIFWKGQDPLKFGRSGRGNRFDPLPAPWAQTQVLYAGTSLETAIAETLLRWQGQIVPGERLTVSESALLKPRRVVRFVPMRPLTVIDATGLGLSRIEDAVARVVAGAKHAARTPGPKSIADDIFQCGPDEYALTQRWGAWFRSQCPDADGFVWVSRQFNVGRCLVLFDDRCRSALAVASDPLELYAEGSVERLIVDQMLGKMRWGVGL
jgi:hypothetical protein